MLIRCFLILLLFTGSLFAYGCATRTPPSLVSPRKTPVIDTVYTYSYALLEPVKRSRLEFQDETLLCRLRPAEKEIGLDLINLSKDPIVIDWDAIELIDAKGVSHPVVHRLVNLSDISREQLPVMLLPQGALTDAITPKPLVYMDITGWERQPIFPRSPDALALRGKNFGIVIPVRANEKALSYHLKFEVADVQAFVVKR